MTTQSWSTVMDHGGDAGFRAWGSELAAKMAAAGLVQTSDTGQINWVTVTRPGTNTDAGYEIWQMNDTPQGTAPVYFRIDYGTGTAATAPRIKITSGTGSNGSGTITGTALTTARICGTGAPLSAVIAYQSYLCVTEGFFGFAWKVGLATADVAHSSFFFCRNCDSDGVPDVIGSLVVWGNGTINNYAAYQFLRYAATAAAFTARTAANQIPTVVPGVPSSSLVGSDNQAYIWWMAIPQVLPVLGLCTTIRTEVATGATFAVTLIGSTSHTYIALGQTFHGEPTVAATFGPAMLWE